MSRFHLAGIAFAPIILMGAAAPPTTPPPVDPSTVTMTTTNLGEGVAVIFGQGGNIGVSYGADGTILVDDQFAPLTAKVTAAATALDKRPIRFVINTHWHFDHTGGNENLGKAGAVIVAHDKVRTRMSSESFIGALNYKFPPSPKEALPVITFAEEVTFHHNGDTMKVTYIANAHTDGDAMIKWEKANVLHMGDVFNRAGVPFVDRSSGGTVLGMIAAIEKAITQTDANTKVIPGHGPMSTRADMIAYRDQLRTFNARVATEKAAGKSMQQILDMKLPWEAATGVVPSDRLVLAAYEDLDAKK